MVDEQDVQWLMVTTGSGEEVVFFTYAVLYYIRRCKAQQQQYDEANVGLNNAGTYVYDTTTQKLPGGSNVHIITQQQCCSSSACCCDVLFLLITSPPTWTFMPASLHDQA